MKKLLLVSLAFLSLSLPAANVTRYRLISSTAGLLAGSVGSPSLYFSSDADGTGTGIYRVGANSLGFAANGVLVGSYTSAGLWTLGATSGISQHVVNGQSWRLNYATAASTASLQARHSDNTSGTSHSILYLETGGSSGGDPKVQYFVVGGNDWAEGIDNSDSQSYVLSHSSNLGTNNVLRCTTSNTCALTGTASGNLSYTANQYGLVASGAANTATVIAPDASTTKVLVSGGASANPTWGTVAAGAMPAHTGDVTSSAGSVAMTAAATQANITTLSNAAGVAIHGVATNSNAAAGDIGEELSATASGVSLSNGSTAAITNLAITAGHWRVSGTVCFLNSGMTASMAIGAIHTNNTGLGSNYDGTKTAVYPIQNNDTCVQVGPFPLKLSGTTTYYLNGREDFSAGSGTGGGTIRAIRVR